MKKILVIVLPVIAIVCMRSFASGSGDEIKEYNCLMGSSSLGGTWYPTACKLANVAKKYEDLTIIVQATGGAVENVRLMAQNELQMGLVDPAAAGYAYRGIGMFEEDGPQLNQRMVTDLYPNVACAVVRKNGPIKSFYDFDSSKNGGKKYGFSPGSPGSGDELCWIEILSVFDVATDELLWVPSSHQERVTSYQDRILDCVSYFCGQPSGSMIEASAREPIRILPIEGEVRKKLCEKFPWYAPIVLPAGMYNGVDEPVETIYIGGYVNANEDVPEQFIYKYLKALFGPGLKEVQSVTEATKDIKLESALGGNKNGEVVPLHPGAVKFFKEKGMIK